MPVFTPNVPIVTSTPTIAVEGLPVGTHRFQLIVEDESGNRSQPSLAIVTVSSRAPVITSVSPTFGIWGDQVVITGANFATEPLKNRVSFNGVAARVETATSTQLTVRVPQPATTGPLRVTTGTGEAVSSTLFVIPRVFTMEVGNADIASQPIEFALDTVTGNLWVLNMGPVINSKRGVVAIINLEQKKLLNFIFVGNSPTQIAAAPAGKRRLCVVLNLPDGLVSAIDLDSLQVVANIRLPPDAAGRPPLSTSIDITPDGRWAYVLINPFLSSLPASVLVVDMTTFKIVGSIPVPEVGPSPFPVVFSADGQFAVVRSFSASSIALIDAAAHKVLAAIKVGRIINLSPTQVAVSQPTEVVFSPENFPIWTTNFGTFDVSVINKDALAAPTNVDLGFRPDTVAVTRDGKRAFIMGKQEPSLAIVDTASGKPILKTIKLPGVPGGQTIALTPDDRGVVFAHFDTSAMSVLDAKTLDVRAVIKLPEVPRRLLITNDGKFAAVLGPKTVSIVEMESVLPVGT